MSWQGIPCGLAGAMLDNMALFLQAPVMLFERIPARACFRGRIVHSHAAMIAGIIQEHEKHKPRLPMVLGTWLLATLSGHNRYEHITGLRGEKQSGQRTRREFNADFKAASRVVEHQPSHFGKIATLRHCYRFT